MNNTWRALINENFLSDYQADILDAIQDLNPLVFGGEEIPEETQHSRTLSFKALDGWLYDVKDSGLFIKYEFVDLRDVVRYAHHNTRSVKEENNAY